MSSRKRRHDSRAAASNGLFSRGKLALAALVVIAIVAAAFLWLREGGRGKAQLPMAIRLVEEGDFRGGEIALKSVLQENPDNAEARFRLGYVLYRLEKYPAAEKELRLARKKGARDPALLPMLGRTLLRLRQGDRLLDEIKPGPEMSAPQRAEILVLRAKAWLASGKLDEAEQSLKDAEQAGPAHPEVRAARAQMLFALGQQEQGLARLEEVLSSHGEVAEFWNLKGDMCRLLERKQEARAAYAKASALEPQSLPPRLSRISLLIDGNELETAKTQLQEAERLAAGHPLLHYLEALLSFRQGQYEGAQTHLQQLLKVAPDYPPAHLLAGAVQLLSGNRETAIGHLNRYLKTNPEHAYAQKLLAVALVETGQVERAKEMVEQMKAPPSDPLMASLRGDIALRGGDLPQARRHLAEAVQASSDNPALLTQLAGRLLASGDEAGARAALEKAAALDQNSERPETMLVMLHLKAKRFDQASALVERLEQAHPRAPLNPTLRGLVALARGDSKSAEVQFEAALRLDPKFLPATANLARLDLKRNDIAAARLRYVTLLRQAPGNGKAWTALAELAQAQGDENAFLDAVTNAKRVSPKDPLPSILATRHWIKLDDTGKALTEARAGLDATGSPRFHEVLGAVHLLRRDPKQAAATYRKWVEAAPRDPQAHFSLARALIALGDPLAADHALAQVLEIDPDFSDAVLTRIELQIQKHNLAEAENLADSFRKRHPRLPAGAEAMARVRAAQGQHASAAKLWEEAVRLGGNTRHAVLAMEAHGQAGQANTGDAFLAKWIDGHPQDIAAHHALAKSRLARGLDQGAMAQYEALLKQAPQDLVALNNLATLYGRHQDKRALATAQAAWRLAPDNPSVLDTLGWVLSESGQPGPGLPHLRKALAGQPDEPEIRWHLAVTLARASDRAGAIAELDRLLASRVAFAQRDEARALLEKLRAGKS